MPEKQGSSEIDGLQRPDNIMHLSAEEIRKNLKFIADGFEEFMSVNINTRDCGCGCPMAFMRHNAHQ